jgi:hypothetical protein
MENMAASRDAVGHRSDMAACKAFIDTNLVEISRELIGWKATGLLPGERLREAAAIPVGLDTPSAMGVAESVAVKLALTRVIEMTPDACDEPSGPRMG